MSAATGDLAGDIVSGAVGNLIRDVDLYRLDVEEGRNGVEWMARLVDDAAALTRLVGPGVRREQLEDLARGVWSPPPVDQVAETVAEIIGRIDKVLVRMDRLTDAVDRHLARGDGDPLPATASPHPLQDQDPGGDKTPGSGQPGRTPECQNQA